MEYEYTQQPNSMLTLRELRERMPMLHPYAALNLTIEPMLVNGEIESERYIEFAAALLIANGKPLYTPN